MCLSFHASVISCFFKVDGAFYKEFGVINYNDIKTLLLRKAFVHQLAIEIGDSHTGFSKISLEILGGNPSLENKNKTKNSIEKHISENPGF